MSKEPPKDQARESVHNTSAPLIPDHELLRCIGRGSYGEVWLARNVMGTYRAVKVVYRRTFEHERPYEREFRGIQKFEPVSRTHEGLVDILQVGRNDQARYFYYVMELADDMATGQQFDSTTYEQKTLADTVTDHKALSVEDCLQLGLSIASAVGHLHKHGLIHRDIKPSNIIIVNGVPKLADIGLVTDTATPSIPGGTLGYLAPEGMPSPQADIYSLGKVLYEISTGKDRQEYPELPEHWGDGTETDKRYEINEIILKACQTDRSNRYQSAEELCADLVLLQAGKSVKRLRTLERRVALLTKIGLVSLGLGLLAAGAYYQTYREKKFKTLQLAKSYVAFGTRSMDEGDLFDSLPWFSAALSLDHDDGFRTRAQRVRIASVLRQCPKILNMWFADGPLAEGGLSPDGREVFVAGASGFVTAWDVSSDRQLYRFAAHTHGVHAVSFSPDGHLVLTAGEDQTARVWKAGTAELTLELPHSHLVHSARFNASGDRIVTACADKTVRVWDARSGHVLKTFTNHTQAARQAAFSPNGQFIVTAGEDATTYVWEWDADKVVLRLQHAPKLKASDNWIYYACFSPDGRCVATASHDQTIQVLDLEKNQLMGVFHHPGAVESVEFSPDSRLVVAACGDFTARIWEIATAQELVPPLKHNTYVKHARFSPEGKRVLTVNALGVVSLWDIAPEPDLQPLTAIFFSADGNRSATISNHVAQVQDANRAFLPPIRADAPIRDIKFNYNGTRLVTITLEQQSGTIRQVARLWDALNAQPLGPPFAYSNQIAALSRDGYQMLTASSASAQLWNTTNGQAVHRPFPHNYGTNAASFHPDGTRLLIVAGTNVTVWDTRDGTRLFTCPHPCVASHAEFSPNGRYLVTACRDNETVARHAQVWDVETGAPIGSPMLHSDGVAYASFSPDSKWVVTAGEDRTAVIWNVETGARVRRLPHAHGVYEASFSADGRWILTVSGDDSARVWDAETGAPITPPLKHDWSLWHARFIDRGQRLLAKRLKGEYWIRWQRGREPVPWEWRIWELTPDDRPLDDLVLLAQLLSGHQSDPSGGTMPLGNEALREGWEKLRAKYPADFRTSANQMTAWHQREAAACEKAKQWFAARFHLDRLLARQPDEPSLVQRRTRAAEELDRLALRSN